MTLNDILQTKGRTVHSIDPTKTLADAVDELVKHNVGSLIVYDGPNMVGIVTERDILRACAARVGSLDDLRVGDFMSTPVVTGSPEDRIPQVMGLLTEKRIRHLPIVDQDQLVGMISIGDLVKAHHDELSVENHYLKNYIHG